MVKIIYIAIMKFIKNLKIFFTIITLTLLMAPGANSVEECFEKTSEPYSNLIWL